ncbi:hypothetical protein HKX48_006263 [Thoreauomyces humboldtii]|nr:hypothetical protein HKX48_006263 [Thoreauomyces humboldtii]
MDRSSEGCLESFLETPAAGEDSNDKLQRGSVRIAVDEDRFKVKERNYTQQYAGIYYMRLNMLRPRAMAAATERWGKSESNPTLVSKVLDVLAGQVCYIVGTVYVDMPLKPNILDEVTQEHWIIAPPPREKYATEEDTVVLEDESGRVKLTGAILKSTMLVTGIVMAVLGCETAAGEFEVVDICYPALKPQKPFPDATEDKFVALVSGLSIGADDVGLELQLLTDYLTGEIGTTQDQKQSASIVRVVIAGNSVSKPKPVADDKRPTRNKYGAETAMFDAGPLKELDSFLAEICETVSVDLLPGPTDPANYSLPQQAIHYAVFPKTSRYSTFHPVTNPYEAEIEGVSLLATSGQTLDDIFRFVASEDRLSMSEKTLQWSHLAPTAPDTLWCHPYKEDDPFVLKNRPNIYVIGNQPKYQTSVIEDQLGRTRVVILPSFAASRTIVLVNLRTLEVSPVNFLTQF